MGLRQACQAASCGHWGLADCKLGRLIMRTGWWHLDNTDPLQDLLIRPTPPARDQDLYPRHDAVRLTWWLLITSRYWAGAVRSWGRSRLHVMSSVGSYSVMQGQPKCNLVAVKKLGLRKDLVCDELNAMQTLLHLRGCGASGTEQDSC